MATQDVTMQNGFVFRAIVSAVFWRNEAWSFSTSSSTDQIKFWPFRLLEPSTQVCMLFCPFTTKSIVLRILIPGCAPLRVKFTTWFCTALRCATRQTVREKWSEISRVSCKFLRSVGISLRSWRYIIQSANNYLQCLFEFCCDGKRLI